MKKPVKYYFNAAKEWIKRAEEDIRWTENNINSGFFTQACFTAQQVAEKSLKAFLRKRGVEIDRRFKTHQLVLLLRRCQEFDQEFASLEKKCRILNEYYAPTRYPEILGLEFRGYGKEQATEALSLAKKVFEFVKRRLE